MRRNCDAGVGRRRSQAAHYPQPVLGIPAAAVLLHHHSIAVGESDHVGPVLEPSDGPRRVGDRSREHVLVDKKAGVGWLLVRRDWVAHGPDATRFDTCASA
jgi:hypothetical protein